MEEGLKLESFDAQPPDLIWLTGKMMMAPVAVLAFGLELLNQTIRDATLVTRRSFGMVTDPRLSSHNKPVEQPQRTTASQAGGPEVSQTKESGTHKDDTQELPKKEKEKITMSYESGMRRDRDLQDDMLKLVRYKILFVRRDFEHAFPEREDLVYDSMDGSAFAAWKVAEFIQELQKGETPVPAKWIARNYPDARYASNGMLVGLEDEDKKYLRVYYEVLERYVREKFYYEEQQIEVLRKIAENMQRASGNAVGSVTSPGSSTLQIGGPPGKS